jgi:hypothetical protein
LSSTVSAVRPRAAVGELVGDQVTEDNVLAAIAAAGEGESVV